MWTVKKLTPKMTRFCDEWCVDCNGTRAAKAAGYKNPQVMSSRLLANPLIQKYIRGRHTKIGQKLEIKAEDVLRQLWCCINRRAKDFFDEEGKLLGPHELPEIAQCSIDSIEQEVVVLRDREGEVIGEKIKNKYRLVPKAHAIDMGMKHKGLFEAIALNLNTVGVNWDDLVMRAPASQNVINAKVIETTAQRHIEQGPVLEPNYSLDELVEDEND